MDLTRALRNRINRELHRNVSHIARDVLECFELYDWPGSVRELENLPTKSVALSTADTLTRELLPDHF